MCNGSTLNCEVAFMECEKCSVSPFVTTTKNKSCGHERKYVITEAVLHICPVYKKRINK
jgi:hypothetical protein